MPTIKLETIINAPIEICFNLYRKIALNKRSTGEKMVLFLFIIYSKLIWKQSGMHK